MSNTEVHEYYFDSTIPPELAENFKDLFPEHCDLSFDDILLMQESAILSIQANSKKENTSSVHADSQSSGSRSSRSRQEDESGHRGSIESQLATDEALARSLQELGDDFLNDFCIDEERHNATESSGNTHAETPSRAISYDTRQDDIDPDNMTYEQLQSLGESVGHESKGLPQELIDQLPSFKYKSGLFSKKKKEDSNMFACRCVICCMAFKNGDRLSILPCAHRYHSECIKRWLKINKSCPVCQKEVQDY